MFPLIRLAPLAAPVLFALASLAPTAAHAQEAGTVMVSIYRIAPGKQLEFLRWQAARDAAAAEAGVAPSQWYVHMDGDDWDFVSVSPETTDEQDAKLEQILSGKRLTTGFKAGLEFRSMVASHTDTIARGPTTAAALVEMGR
jgi:hypothetical protein